MNLFKKIFGNTKQVGVIETKPKKPVLNYSEIAKIANANAKNIQGNINQARVMLNGMGVRAGKKYKTRIIRLKKKLEEEQFYADYYSNPSKYYSKRIRQEG